MKVTHHGINFSLDTDDWSDEASASVAEDALIEGLTGLSEADAMLIAEHWTSGEAECDSRNANDSVAQLVESIERLAFSKATEGWYGQPESGHNCSISIAW